MRKGFGFVFLLISGITFSQKKVSKTFETLSKEINIYTTGLDNLLIENSNSDIVEVFLVAESYDEQLIEIENTTQTVNIKFDFKGTETREVVFRKFITKRLQRANAIVKIPKNKIVYVFGENVDIESKNITNKLAIYIENGIVKLNRILADTTLKFYSGNVYGSIKNINVDLQSKNGKIEIDGVLQEKSHQKIPKYSKNNLNVFTIKGNVFLATE
jgi:hypothetical protein